jgi:hypothetical protein
LATIMPKPLLILAVVLASAAARAAQPPVYLYHDDARGGFNYLAASKDVLFSPGGYWPILPGTADVTTHHRELMAGLRAALAAAGIPAEMLDAAGWGKLCRERTIATVVDICQAVPDTVFKGESQGAPVREWLHSGGNLVYAGDWPFYWYADAAGKTNCEGAASQGDDDVFGADLVKEGFTDFVTNPSDAAKRLLPSLMPSWTQRPFDLAAVQKLCPWSEAYLVGERGAGPAHQLAADGLAFRPPDAKGYFVGFHFRRGMHTDTNQLVYEFLTLRAPALFGGARP